MLTPIGNEEFDEAVAGSSVTITIEDDINVTRGDILVKSDEVPQSSKTLKGLLSSINLPKKSRTFDASFYLGIAGNYNNRTVFRI